VNTRNVKRKLAALVSADVVGYSRLMGDDEMGTVFLVMESILPGAWRVWLRQVAFASLGGALVFSGLPEKALGYLEKAIRLNPTYPEYYIFT